MSAIRFLFDYVSPYSYLAWTQIHALAHRHAREVEPVPVLFAGLLRAHGTKGPAEVPAKRAYMHRDILRIARAFDVPLEPPASHPFNPLLALRVSTLELDAKVRRALVDGLFRAVWAGGPGVTEPDVVAGIARKAGLDDRAVATAMEAEAKARLRRNTDLAVEAGVFGVPTMLADGEMFWGVDSLPYLDRFLRGEGRIDEEALAAWRGVKASAERGAV